MPLNHTMSRDEDCNRSACNPTGAPDTHQCQEEVPMSFDQLRDELRALMRREAAAGRPVRGGWFG